MADLEYLGTLDSVHMNLELALITDTWWSLGQMKLQYKPLAQVLCIAYRFTITVFVD